MPSDQPEIWYSFFDRGNYYGDEPAFFDSQKLGWINEIEKNSEIIKNELAGLLKNQPVFQPYFNSSLVKKEFTWKTFSLSWWGVNLYKNQKLCPQTTQVINRVKNLVSASFNLLEPGATILPHCGDTNGIYRCHLGLIIPGTIPGCGFKVAEDSRSWEEGKTLVFCDAHKHTAWNFTDKPRYIFLFDVIREEISAEKKMICATVLGSLFLQKLGQQFPFLEKTPMKIQFILHFIIKCLIVIYVPVRNLLSKIFS